MDSSMPPVPAVVPLDAQGCLTLCQKGSKGSLSSRLMNSDQWNRNYSYSPERLIPLSLVALELAVLLACDLAPFASSAVLTAEPFGKRGSVPAKAAVSNTSSYLKGNMFVTLSILSEGY